MRKSLTQLGKQPQLEVQGDVANRPRPLEPAGRLLYSHLEELSHVTELLIAAAKQVGN